MKLMRSRYGRMLGLTLAVSLVIALGAQPGRSQQSDDAGFLPMQTSVNALMVALVDHAAHELWEMGSRETLTARDWQTTEQHATQLIASGTLISLGGTGTADPSWAAAPDWQEWSRDLTDAGAAALAAARTTDQDALHAAGLALLDACEGCHRAFKPELPTEGLTHFPHYEISSRGTVTLKAAVVALAAQPALRREFEDGLVAKALAAGYNAVTSYELVPDVTDVSDPDFTSRLVSNGIGAVLMIRPAAVGPGASLESVRNSVSASTYSNMRAFSRQLSRSGEGELLAVVHLGLYLVSVHGAELLSSGAVWLDQPNPSHEEGIERLQNLIVANVNGVRPAIRQHLGLPPLEQQ